MYQKFTFRCIQDFCSDNRMKNGCEKNTLISSRLFILLNIVIVLSIEVK